MSTATEEATTAPLHDRSRELGVTLHNLLAAHEEWRASDKKHLTQDFCDALEDALEVWNRGDVPGELRRMAPRFEALERIWREWLMTHGGDEGGDVADPGSGSPLWKTIAMIGAESREAEERAQEPVQCVEPISMLREQKVPDKQICRMYRAHWPEGATDGPGLWNNAKMQPMLARLIQEIKKPGSVLGPGYDEFVPYEAVERLAKEREQREAAARATAKLAARLEKEAVPDPTPLEDLVAEGVSCRQIARMKKTTIEDIETQCRQQGLTLPPRDYPGMTKPGEGKFDKEPTDAQERIQEARSRAFQNRKRIDEMKTDTPAAPPQDRFGGDPDAAPEAAGDDLRDETEAGHEFSEGQDVPRVSDLERQVAEIMQAGTTRPKDIATQLGRDDWQSIRSVIGRLKGDPARMDAALGK